jgi:F-type H+-transporting ATPase subunit a
MAILILTAWLVNKKINNRKDLVPGRLLAALELIIEIFDNLCTETMGDKKRARLFFPFIMTIFLFIWLGNIMDVIPPVFNIIPDFKAPAADLNTTLGIGIVVFLVFNLSGIYYKGLINYFSEWFQPFFFMFPLNAVGEVAKVVSLSFRLFGNIMGGGIIIIVVGHLVHHLIIPIALDGFFGIFVGTIQAFVFTMLSLVYISVAISEDEEEEEHK